MRDYASLLQLGNRQLPNWKSRNEDRILAEYALHDINKPIGVADYELTRALPKELASSLPTIEQIETELQNELEDQS